MNTTCWHTDISILNMLSAYNKNPDLLNTEHGRRLQDLTEQLSCLKCIDIGCGSANANVLFKNYTGLDLPYIIDNLSKKTNPELNYIRCNAETDYINFLIYYDVVLLNAFIDIMKYPLKMLDKILKYAKNYVIIHRQEITEHGDTKAILNQSYGGHTWHSIINRKDFDNLIKKHNFEILKEVNLGFDNWENSGSSFLLKKAKHD